MTHFKVSLRFAKFDAKLCKLHKIDINYTKLTLQIYVKKQCKNYTNVLINISSNSANAAVTTKNIKIGTKIIAIR